MKANPIKIGTSMVKRAKRAKGQQSTGMPCIICGNNFSDCPHSRYDIDKVVNAIELAEMLGIEIGAPK